MSTPRKNYVRHAQGFLAAALAGGSTRSAVLLEALIIEHPSRRALPGVVQLGPAGLAESLPGFKLNEVRRDLNALRSAGRIVMDDDAFPPTIFVVGTASNDPPTSPNACEAMARQLCDLPASVGRHVWREITKALEVVPVTKGKPVESPLFERWMALTGELGFSDPVNQGPSLGESHGLSVGVSQGPPPNPIPTPRPIPTAEAAASNGPTGAAQPVPAHDCAPSADWSIVGLIAKYATERLEQFPSISYDSLVRDTDRTVTSRSIRFTRPELMAGVDEAVNQRRLRMSA